MESLRWQLFEQYGPDARIIRAEKIQTGGLFGLGATTSFEVLVELAPVPERAVAARVGSGAVQAGALHSDTPRAVASRRGTGSHRGLGTRRTATPRRSMSDLLAAADDADDARPTAADEARPAAGDARPAAVPPASSDDARPAAVPPASSGDARPATNRPARASATRPAGTRSAARSSAAAPAADTAENLSAPDFHAILQNLSEPEEMAVPGPVPAPKSIESGVVGTNSGHVRGAAPRPLTTPGAVVILAGRRDQPLTTAWSMAAHLQDGADVLTAGDHRHYGTSHVFLDSVEVQKAQSAAARAGKPLLIAFSFGQRGASKLSMLASLRAQQLWFVVDAAHKPEDTASWVGRACRYSVPDGLAVLGVTDTATPESVNQLGIPVGWVDGRQAASNEL